MIFCSLPFETFTAVGDIVRQAYPGKNIAVLGCADHNRSYLPVITPEWRRSYRLFRRQCFMALLSLILTQSKASAGKSRQASVR